MSFQNETKARGILGLWQGASEAHIRQRSATSEQRSQRPKKQVNWSHFVSELELNMPHPHVAVNPYVYMTESHLPPFPEAFSDLVLNVECFPFTVHG